MNTIAPSTMRRVVVVNDTRPDRHYGCQAVMEALLLLLAQNGLRPIHFHPVGVPWSGDTAFLEAAAVADAIVVNGEGSIHHSNDRALSLARLGSFCRFTLRRPGILLNATLAANDERIYSHLRHFNLIAARDQATRLEAARFGLDAALYCPDLSLFHDLSAARRTKPRSPPQSVAVTDSVVKPASAAIASFAARHRFPAAPIGFVPAAGRSIYDYAFRIGALDLLVTGRYHAVCYAIATSTPFVAVESNTPKISSLLSDVFGHTRRVVPPEALAELSVADYAGWTDAEQASLHRFGMLRDAAYRDLGQAMREAVVGSPAAQGPGPLNDAVGALSG
jgi:hypothetical protein